MSSGSSNLHTLPPNVRRSLQARDPEKHVVPRSETRMVDVDVVAFGGAANTANAANNNYQLMGTLIGQCVMVELLYWKATHTTNNPNGSGQFRDNCLWLDFSLDGGVSDIPVQHCTLLPAQAGGIKKGLIMLPIDKDRWQDLSATSYRTDELSGELNVPICVWDDPESKGVPIERFGVKLLRTNTTQSGQITIDNLPFSFSEATYTQLYLRLRFHMKSLAPRPTGTMI